MGRNDPTRVHGNKTVAVGDLLNDSSNNSAVDILKHTVPGQQRMDDLVSVDLADTLEFPASGVAFFLPKIFFSS